MKVYPLLLSLLFSCVCLASNTCLAQKAPTTHYVCIMNDGTYHDRSGCALLQLCSGAKFRKTTNIENLKPCKKCARPVVADVKGDFQDIKRILGVKDRKQIADSIGTSESLIKRDGYTLRILGSPGTKTINTLEFFLSERTPFIADSLLSETLFKKLGLNFEGCRADTIRNLTPHPVTHKVDPSFTIEYRNCAVVERRDAYDDISKYYYRLLFLPNEADQLVFLDKIQLVLTVER